MASFILYISVLENGFCYPETNTYTPNLRLDYAKRQLANTVTPGYASSKTYLCQNQRKGSLITGATVRNERHVGAI